MATSPESLGPHKLAMINCDIWFICGLYIYICMVNMWLISGFHHR